MISAFEDGDTVTGGHTANVQLGPVRPTALPSGQIFASCVQVIGEEFTGIEQVSFLIAARVAGPVLPTWDNPMLFWYIFTAVSVAGPKYPFGDAFKYPFCTRKS